MLKKRREPDQDQSRDCQEQPGFTPDGGTSPQKDRGVVWLPGRDGAAVRCPVPCTAARYFPAAQSFAFARGSTSTVSGLSGLIALRRLATGLPAKVSFPQKGTSTSFSPLTTTGR